MRVWIRLNNFLRSTPAYTARFFPTRKNVLASINRHSKNFITRAFPLLMSRRLSKCERLTATLAETLLKLLKVMSR